ncbi:MAG: hypothetical protein ACPGRC_08565 [Salibacteraceae bacterium]
MKKGVWHDTNTDLLEKYPDLVLLVWAQIQKDFLLEAIEIENKSISTLDDIYEILYPLIGSLITTNFNSIMRLLYRIDISESKVKKGMDLMPDDTGKAISTLILKREIQKVLLRKQYSSGN